MHKIITEQYANKRGKAYIDHEIALWAKHTAMYHGWPSHKVTYGIKDTPGPLLDHWSHAFPQPCTIMVHPITTPDTAN